MVEHYFHFSVPTKIGCGYGLVDDFGAEWEPLGVRRVLVVADAGIVAAGLLARVVQGLAKAGAEVVGTFTAVPPNSELHAVKACAFEAREKGAEVFVAVGGGSVIDTAKLAGLLASHGGELSDYVGAQTIPHPLMPLVVIPTTAGTGSEVSQAAVVYDAAAQRKLSFIDQHLRPRLALLDPTVTVSLPPTLTVATGMDALTHAVEAFTGLEHSPAADAAALQALRLIRHALPVVALDGANLAARQEMLIASTLAGIAFDHSMVGVIHAMAHAVGALAPVHHGTANAILLPYGMKYNWEVCRRRYSELAVALGLGKSEARSAGTLRTWLAAFRAELHAVGQLPLNLREAGVREDQLAAIAELAEEDGASFYNPRPVEAKRLRPLLRAAWEGK